MTNFLLRLPFHLLMALGLVLAAKGALIPAKAWAAQVLLERAFAQGLATGRPAKAWPWADAAPIARLSVPRLRASAVVLSGGSGEALAFGPTHLPASAPIGGRGTAVFAAHRDTHFRFLKDVRPATRFGFRLWTAEPFATGSPAAGSSAAIPTPRAATSRSSPAGRSPPANAAQCVTWSPRFVHKTQVIA
jgi:hypothetical protein